MHSAEIVYRGVILTVGGYYTPEEPASPDSPGVPESFEVAEVYVPGSRMDIIELLSADQIDEIETIVLQQINGEAN